MDVLGKLSSSKAKLQPGDTNDILKWGILGFVGAGAYQLAQRLNLRSIDQCVDLKDRVEAFNMDPVILDSFLRIQPYRPLNPWGFSMAVRNTDYLLFLENALLKGDVAPVRNDRVLAFSYFRVAVTRLNMIQHEVKSKMSNEHALAMNIYVKKIYQQLRKHLLNVLHLCSTFKPEHMLQRAEADVARVMQRFASNSGRTGRENWERVSKNKGTPSDDSDVRPEDSVSNQHASRRRRRKQKR